MVTTGFALDTDKDDSGLHYLAWLREAMAAGKSLTGVVRDVASLTWGPGKLQPCEYFLYRLYDDQRFPPDVKRTFLGSDRQSQILEALNMPWQELSKDKPTLTALLRGYDLPIPETQAMRHSNRSFPGAMPLRNKADVERFLRRQADYPIFTKPTNSVCSLGVANIERYDAATDCLVTNDGRQVPIAQFAEQVEKYAEGGYLFQTRLAPHPKIVELLGNQVSTVRMFVLVDDEGPMLLRASWKIPSGETVADNFWRSGNMLGGIDVETGRVTRVLRRTPNGTEVVTTHPKSGASFEGLTFPEWDRMREVVLQGCTALPSCHFQGWDVALTDRGPVLVELEGDGGDPIMEQLCFDSGLLQGRYLKFASRAMELKKERKKRAKERARRRRRENFAQLSMRQESSAASRAVGQKPDKQEEKEELAASST
jgi:Sugar-transfer associated ATP-grasp